MSPLPAWCAATQLVLFSRQVPEGTAVRTEVVAADATTGELTLLGTAGTIATPAVARLGAGLLVAWPAASGGVAVTVRP
jgi:hypothetical protein